MINALNRDLPYDQFVVDQIAGDLLPNPTQDQIVATGFLRNSMINEEGGIDPEQFRMAAMFDRMDAIGTAILGLTIQCGQCHSHKYDPLTQEEYYRLFAFINDSHEASVSVFTTEEQQLRQRIFAEIARIEDHLKTSDPDWLANMAAWEASLNVNQPDWQVLDLTFDDGSLGGQKLLSQSDGSMLAQGYAPTKSRPKLMANTSLRGITGFRLELLTDPNLPRGGPGRSLLGTAALTEFEVHAASLNAPEQAKKVPIASATSNLNAPQKELDKIFNDKSDKRRVTGPIAFALDGDGLTAWGTDAGPGRRNQPREAVFAAETAIDHQEGVALTFYLTQNHGGWNSDDNQTHNLGRFRLSVTNTPAPKADPLPARVREALSPAPAKRTASDVATIFGYWRTTVPAWQASNEEIERLWSQHPEGHSQLVLQARDEPRTTHMLERGDFLKPSRPVSPGVPAFLACDAGRRH